MPRLSKKVPLSKKKPAKQLDHEINKALAKRPNGNGNGGMERVTRERVHEPLIGERITRSAAVYVTCSTPSVLRNGSSSSRKAAITEVCRRAESSSASEE